MPNFHILVFYQKIRFHFVFKCCFTSRHPSGYIALGDCFFFVVVAYMFVIEKNCLKMKVVSLRTFSRIVMEIPKVF